ncbi:LysR substrate-binding domain-containing protein [Peristeroidobacter agariperforans]|uniref:LysR substrate-binding domain-containing protein n=1 Tax=Peristeroidobacter agariperforans TaxID=268404 RepID=UPI0018E517DB|nr:LysR substrate-binding domain-containing protein [Peristeroidobacter agariperforans]
MKLRGRQIEVFQAVMEANTLSDAANRLCISQPSVSRILARFEQLAGFKAFEHKGRRLMPTAAARMFYEEVLRMQRGIDHLNRVAEEISNFRRGHVSLAVFPSLSNSWIAAVISEFTQRYTDIHLSVVTRASKDVIEAVDAKRVDLGISLFASASDTIDSREFMVMESVCVLPRTHELCRHRAIQVSDLKGEKLIGLINAESSPVSSQYNIIAGRDIGDAALKASSASAVCHLVAAGRGVSIVSAVVAREHAHLAIETRPLKPRIEQPVYLLRSRHRVYSPLVEMLTEQIANDATSRGRKRA